MLTDRIAPKDKYRVLGVDRFSNEHWVHGDYDTKAIAEAEAIALQKEQAEHASHPSIATTYYVYDDTGKHVGP